MQTPVTGSQLPETHSGQRRWQPSPKVPTGQEMLQLPKQSKASVTAPQSRDTSRDQGPHPGHTWVLSSRGHSAGRTQSGGHRAPRAGSGDTAGGSHPHGIQEHRDPCRGSRSSRAGRPSRNHPRVSRAGCACSSHSCVGTEALRSQRPTFVPLKSNFHPTKNRFHPTKSLSMILDQGEIHSSA